MARIKNNAELMKTIGQYAASLAVGDEVLIQRYGKKGRTQYGSTRLAASKSAGRSAKTLLKMGELITLLGKQYADDAPANPDYPHTPRVGGGLLWHGQGGVPRASYPFRRSDRRMGERPYRNSWNFYAAQSSRGPQVVIENRAPTAGFVELGTIGAGEGGMRTLRARARREFTGIGPKRRRLVKGAGRFEGKTYGGFMAIPLKAQRYSKALRQRNLTYAQRKANKQPSVQPEYRQYMRAKRRREGRLWRDGKRVSPREEFVDARGVRRSRNVKVPTRPQAVKDSIANLRARDDKATPFRFIGEDKAGRPTLFIRRINLYGPYGILRRAVNDGTAIYLRG